MVSKADEIMSFAFFSSLFHLFRLLCSLLFASLFFSLSRARALPSSPSAVTFVCPWTSPPFPSFLSRRLCAKAAKWQTESCPKHNVKFPRQSEFSGLVLSVPLCLFFLPSLP